jgi:hypothetical protein
VHRFMRWRRPGESIGKASRKAVSSQMIGLAESVPGPPARSWRSRATNAPSGHVRNRSASSQYSVLRAAASPACIVVSISGRSRRTRSASLAPGGR